MNYFNYLFVMNNINNSNTCSINVYFYIVMDIIITYTYYEINLLVVSLYHITTVLKYLYKSSDIYILINF